MAFVVYTDAYRWIVCLRKKLGATLENSWPDWHAGCIQKRVHRSFLLLATGLCALAFTNSPVRAEGLSGSRSHFYYRNSSGNISGARIIRRYYRGPIIHPSAQIDPRLDPRLRHAASIAEERSSARTKARCWRYVKQALLDAGAVSSYPKTNYACQAGEELVRDFGFKKLPVRDPYAAPLGAVIVYGKGAGGAGHVELRTKNGFVSDYHSKNKCFYPVLAIYGKFTS